MAEALKFDAILLRSGELFLKKGNRRRFERVFARRVHDALKGLAVEVRALRHRMLVLLDPQASAELAEEVMERLSLVPGFISMSPALRCEPDLYAITDKAEVLLRATYQQKPFRITAKRSDKTFSLTSSELGRVVGVELEKRTGFGADIYHPELVIEIDVAERHAFIFTERRPGVRGLPAGSSGLGMLLLSGGIDSPVAGHLMINRGMHLQAVYFHSFPFIPEQAKQKVFDLSERLASMQGDFDLWIPPFADIQKVIHEKCDSKLTVLLYRRFMLRIAAALAQQQRCAALVTGESLAQVASQTIENLRAIEEVAELPILRPLIGLDKISTMDIARRIDTYDISIRPYDDCCSLFVPKHPETRANRPYIHRQEARLEIEQLVQASLDNVEHWRVTRQGCQRISGPEADPQTRKDFVSI